MELSEANVYSPLAKDKSFRLLAIRPGSFDEDIQCTLHHCTLDKERRPFETISYCWGDPSERATINVNELSVSVPASSAAALRRVRFRTKVRTVWIDAICINQGDLQERGQQVQFMRHIYPNGLRNLVYLGEANIQDAVKSIKDLQHDITQEFWFRWQRKLRLTFSMIKASFDLAAICNLLLNDWFWRVWTFQEALLARSNVCLCGDSSIHLLTVLKTAVFLDEHRMFLPKDADLEHPLSPAANFFGAISAVQAARKSNHERVVSDLLTSLENTYERKCSVPVDKIYGVLALDSGLSMTPNYENTPVEVCIEAARWIIKSRRSLDILRDVETYRDFDVDVSAPSDTGLPTWVPEWTQTKYRTHQIKKLFTLFSADASILYDASLIDPSSRTLVTSGFAIDTVSNWTALLCSDDSFLATLRRVESLAADAAKVNGMPTSQSRNVVAHTLCCGRDYQSVTGRSDRNLVRYYLQLKEIVERRLVQYDDLWKLGDVGAGIVPPVREYWRCLHLMCRKRRFFVTATGGVGLGPEGVEAGDRLVILYGLSWPAVLRPTQGGYLFIGLAYMHWLMDGEAVQEHKRTESEDETFNIL